MGSLNGKVLGIGLTLTVVGALSMGSTLSLRLRGVETTATLLAHVSECRVEYQLAMSDHRTDLPLDCDAAAIFQDSLGKDKAILHRADFVRLRYAAPGGEPREIKAIQDNLTSPSAPMGALVRIVFDPAHPEAARAPVTLKELGAYFGLMGVGLFLLFLGLGIGPIRMAKALRARLRGAPKALAAEKDVVQAAVASLGAMADANFSAPKLGKRRP